VRFNGLLVVAGTALVLFGADELESTRFIAAAALLAKSRVGTRGR
jgi:hypothetical protein